MDAFLSSMLALCGTYLHMKSPLFSFILLYPSIFISISLIFMETVSIFYFRLLSIH